MAKSQIGIQVQSVNQCFTVSSAIISITSNSQIRPNYHIHILTLFINLLTNQLPHSSTICSFNSPQKLPLFPFSELLYELDPQNQYFSQTNFNSYFNFLLKETQDQPQSIKRTSSMLKPKDDQKKPLVNKKKQQPIKKKQKMKPGEYELHVLVQATSGLYSGDRQQALDVIISVQAFGQKKYSSIKHAVGFEQNFWGEHFYFQTKFNDTSIAQGQKVLISVHNRQKKIFEGLIGNYELSVSTIYNSDQHCIEHRWLALSNVQMNFSEAVGYIKVSVSMLGQDDPSRQLEAQPATGISKQKNVMIPPIIERTNYQLIVEIFQGEYIIPADGKTCDPYIGVQFGHLFSKTDPAMKNTNPIFMQTVYVPLSIPAVNQNIAIRLNDFNYIQKNLVLGSYYIDINQLLRIYKATKKLNKKANKDKNKLNESSASDKSQKTIKFVPEQSLYAINKTLPYTQMQWINFYGPASNASNEEHKNIYQFFPSLAPHYVGSVLLKMSITEQTRPQRKVVKFKGSLPKQKKTYFQIAVDIHEALNLFKKNKPYMISIKCGHFQMQTDAQEAINGFCGWNVKKTMSVFFYENQLVPDIFVYLIDDTNQKVCFQRYSPFPNGEDFDSDRQITVLEKQWVLMKPDLSRIIIQNEEAGYLRMAISITKKEKKFPSSEKRLKTIFTGSQSQGNKGRLIIQLICAEQLIPLDQEGTSDPFFEFIYLQKNAFSSTKDETLNPIYFQKLMIQTDITSDPTRLPPLIVNAYDKDQFSKQFIGTTFIDLSQGLRQKWIAYGMTDRPEPKWFQLKQNNAVAGRFLASFILLPKIIQDIPKTISIPSEKYIMTLLILGIRGLKQNSLIPIKNPYVIFDIDAFEAFQVYRTTEKTASFNIKTQPKEVNEILNLKLIQKRTIRLPSNPLYWPALSAKVKNQIMPGVYEPLIGYFSINLQKAYANTQKAKALYQKRCTVMAEKRSHGFNKYQRLRDIDSDILINLRNAILISLNYSWPVMSKDIELNSNKPNQERYDPDYVVVFPFYQEVEAGKKYQELYKKIISDNECYMKIGFDNNEKRSKKSLLQRDKHYRFFINTTLQEFEQKRNKTKMGMFDESPIKTGRIFPSNNIADTLIKRFVQTDRYIGKYKGHCFIEKLTDAEQSDVVQEQQRKRLQNFLKVQKFHMYLYILEAFNLPDKDLMSKSDPYLIVKIGEKVLNFQSQYFQDEENPQFNKKIYQVIELPDDAVLEIEVWDYDTIMGDDFIGSAIIDLENRAFYQENHILFNNPIETHKLMVKQSKIAQGSIRFWLDLVPHQKHSLYRQYQIGNQDDSEFQVRIIIWRCSDIPDNDIQGMSDLYVTCTFNNETQSTDTHIRASAGVGSFNWRCVYKIKLPSNDTTFSFRVFDKDLLTPDDYISSASFSISNILEQAYETRQAQKLYLGTKDLTKYAADSVSCYKIIDGQKLYDRFEIPLLAKGKKNSSQRKQVGNLQLSVEVLPKVIADKRPVGLGRDGPNQYPFLQQPKDRFQWSWNPLVLMSRLCGQAFRYKLALALIIVAIIFLFYNFFHSFGGSMSANVVNNGIDKAMTG